MPKFYAILRESIVEHSLWLVSSHFHPIPEVWEGHGEQNHPTLYEAEVLGMPLNECVECHYQPSLSDTVPCVFH